MACLQVLESSAKLDLQRFFLERFAEQDPRGLGSISLPQLRQALVGLGWCHFNAISTPFQRHFNAISTPFRRHLNAI